MKKFLLMILVFSTIVYGQVNTDLTIENQHVIGTDFFFDLYLTRTGTNDLYLGNADFVLTFDAVNFSSPVFTKEGDSPAFCNFVPTIQSPANNLFTQDFYFNNTAVEILNVNQLVININGPTPSTQTNFDTRIARIDNTPSTHRLGRFKVSGIINPNGFMNLQWRMSGAGVTTLVFTLETFFPWYSSQVNISASNPTNTSLAPSPPATFQLSVSVSDGWNMVSIPGLHPVNQEVQTWWSGKNPAADVYKFMEGYHAVASVTPGTGYWMYHSGANTYSTGDEWPSVGINKVPHNPLNGSAGWNLIGGYEYDAAVSGITTLPAGLQDSPIYWYSDGYQLVNYLIPGYGYWIRLSAPGSIILPGSYSKNNFKITDYIKEDWGRIIIQDATGISYTLYIVNEKINLNKYELPPPPPAGMFDVRFGSGRFVEELDFETKSIEMSGLKYPIVVYVEKLELKLQDETGKVFNSLLKSGEKVVVSTPLSKLLVSKMVIPEEYSLEQNYPNPFNPSTMIEFALKEDSKNVSLIIYNALGQRVAELINSKLEAGRFSYQWDASGMTSGLYIYELRTDQFIAVKKMLFIK